MWVKRVIVIGVSLAVLNWVILPLFPAVREQRREARIMGRQEAFSRRMARPGAREAYFKAEADAKKQARERAEAPPRVRASRQPRDLAVELLAATTGFPATDFTVTDMAPGLKHANRWQGVGRLERAATWDPKRRFPQRIYFQMDAERRYVEEVWFADFVGPGTGKLDDSQVLAMASAFIARARPGRPAAIIEPDRYVKPYGAQKRFMWRERLGEIYTGDKGEIAVEAEGQFVESYSEYRPPAGVPAPRISREAAQQALAASGYTFGRPVAVEDFRLFLASRSAPNEGPIWEYWHDYPASNQPGSEVIPDIYHVDAVSGQVIMSANSFEADFPKKLDMPAPDLRPIAGAVIEGMGEALKARIQGGPNTP
jgi:hypothetical protein